MSVACLIRDSLQKGNHDGEEHHHALGLQYIIETCKTMQLLLMKNYEYCINQIYRIFIILISTPAILNKLAFSFDIAKTMAAGTAQLHAQRSQA